LVTGIIALADGKANEDLQSDEEIWSLGFREKMKGLY
jgi:hypothetical protein